MVAAKSEVQQDPRNATLANRVADRVRQDLEAPLRRLAASAALSGDGALPPDVAAAVNTIAGYLDALEDHLGDFQTPGSTPAPRLTMALASELSFLARHMDSPLPSGTVERLQPRVRRAARLATLWLTPYAHTSTTTFGPDSESTAAWAESRPAGEESPGDEEGEEATVATTTTQPAANTPAAPEQQTQPAQAGSGPAEPLDSSSTATAQMDEQAARLVARRIADLRDSVRTLEEQIQDREQYWRFTTHELRNAAHMLMLNVERLKGTDSAGAPWVAPLMRSAQAVIRRAEEALESGREAAAGPGVRPERVDLVEIALDALEQARPLADEAGIKLVGERLPLGQAVWAHADPERAGQILHNLLRNAIGATPRDGFVILECSYVDAQAILVVSDTGPGLSPERFEELCSGKGASADAHGFGIGLPLSHHLARAMNGSITLADPQPGLGSRVQLRLPRASA